MKFRRPRGTEDILPDESYLWQNLEETARETFHRYGYSEIRTPIFEAQALFVRSIGEATEIVEKQMYTFQAGKEKESFVLRPEATAPVVRAYLEHHLQKSRLFRKLYYIGPMFRYERPQSGRSRQFHQLGAEAIGSLDPLLDAEVVALVSEIISAVGLNDFELKINSIGHLGCREEYRQVLRKELLPRRDELCENCKTRLDRNIFRVLDCKNESCLAIYRRLPPIVDHLCKDCAKHFEMFRQGLEALGIPYRVDNHLVRGFDYYTRSVFEFTHKALGAQDAIAAGGRYDDLVEEMGGPSLGAVGFALGMERTILAMKKKGKPATEKVRGFFSYIVTVDADSRIYGFEVAQDLRKMGIECDMDYEGRSVRSQMREANRRKARFVLIAGPEELKQNAVKIKDMKSGREDSVPREKVAEVMRNGLCQREKRQTGKKKL